MAKKLSKEKFLESFKLVPRVAIDLLVVKQKRVLLTRRQKEPFAGCWHLPGGFILKGEKIENCIKRLAQAELGVKVESFKLARIWENLKGDPRGHVVDLIYDCELKGEPEAVGDTAEIKYFEKLPKEFGFGQEKALPQYQSR